MRRNLTLIVIGLAFAGVFHLLKGGWSTAAAEPAALPAVKSGSVALLDLAKIYNSHRVFQRLSDDLRREVEDAERELRTRKAELQAESDALEKLTKGSAEAKQLESKIARGSAELQVKVQEQKKDFFEQEAGVYYQVYQQIMKQVEKYADEHGINLVMRFNGDPVDLNDPQGIQKELNKAVLYHKGIDITDKILAILNAEPGS